MENLLNPVDPVVHGQVVHRRCREVTFFAARFCLRSFSIGTKKGKERIIEISSTTNFLLFFFFFLQFLKTDVQSVLFY